MTSPAFHEWQTSGAARLDELERVHTDARGTGPGRRWGTAQLNRSLFVAFVALVAQFQTYCRSLHDDAIDVHVAHLPSARGRARKYHGLGGGGEAGQPLELRVALVRGR